MPRLPWHPMTIADIVMSTEGWVIVIVLVAILAVLLARR